MSDDRCISVGKLSDYPRELWGSRDRARVALATASQQQQELAAHVGDHLADRPLPAGFGLYDKSRPGRDAYSRGVDAVLAAHGIRPRSRQR